MLVPAPLAVIVSSPSVGALGSPSFRTVSPAPPVLRWRASLPRWLPRRSSGLVISRPLLSGAVIGNVPAPTWTMSPALATATPFSTVLQAPRSRPQVASSPVVSTRTVAPKAPAGPTANAATAASEAASALHRRAGQARLLGWRTANLLLRER